MKSDSHLLAALDQTADGLIVASDGFNVAAAALMRASAGLLKANQGLKLAIAAAREAQEEQADLRDTVRKLQAMVTELLERGQ